MLSLNYWSLCVELVWVNFLFLLQVLKFVQSHAENGGKQLLLAGNSVYVDLLFLRVCFMFKCEVSSVACEQGHISMYLDVFVCLPLQITFLLHDTCVCCLRKRCWHIQYSVCFCIATWTLLVSDALAVCLCMTLWHDWT